MYFPLTHKVNGDLFLHQELNLIRQNFDVFAEAFPTVPTGNIAIGGAALGYRHRRLDGVITSSGDTVYILRLPDEPGYLVTNNDGRLEFTSEANLIEMYRFLFDAEMVLRL